MAQRDADGYAADLTEAVTSGPLAGHRGRRRPWRPRSIDGKVVLMPHTAEVIERPVVQRAAARRARRHAAHDVGGAARGVRHAQRGGRHADRDRQQGPLGGGQLAQPPRVARRGRGRLSRRSERATASSRHPSGSRRSATSRNCASTHASTRAPTRSTTTAGAQLFFQGEAAMHPHRLMARELGDRRTRRTWSSTSSTCRRCRRARPATRAASSGSRPGTWSTPTARTSTSRSSSWRSSTRPENVKKFIRGRDHAARRPRPPSGDVDGRSARLGELLERGACGRPAAGHRLRPRDRRIELYAAEAAVLDGTSTPADALAALDERLGR